MTIRYSLARRKARELLERGGIVAPPVPVQDLAAMVGAAIVRKPFEGERMSGMLQRLPGGKAVIGVNSSESATRRRFTIAHELGHLVLHTENDLHVDEHFAIAFRDEVSSKAVDPREIEANQFAAELLMPESMLRRDLENVGVEGRLDEVDIEQLARRYRVSIQAITIRLSRLGVLA